MCYFSIWQVTSEIILTLMPLIFGTVVKSVETVESIKDSNILIFKKIYYADIIYCHRTKNIGKLWFFLIPWTFYSSNVFPPGLIYLMITISLRKIRTLYTLPWRSFIIMIKVRSKVRTYLLVQDAVLYLEVYYWIHILGKDMISKILDIYVYVTSK